MTNLHNNIEELHFGALSFWIKPNYFYIETIYIKLRVTKNG